MLLPYFYFSVMSAFSLPSYTFNKIVSLLRASILLSLWSCSASVEQYSTAELLAPNKVNELAGETSLDLTKTKLCQGFRTEWDSILVLKPYVREALVQALPVANYQAVSDQVWSQRLSDQSCTLLFVKAGRYRAYCVVPRSTDWSQITKSSTTELVWLTQQDCPRLLVKRAGNTTDGKARYVVLLTELP